MLGKEKIKPFEANTQDIRHAIDAVSTDTTGPVTPPDIEGNVYLQLVVDASSGHTKGFPIK